MDAASLLDALQTRVSGATITSVPALDDATFYVSREHVVETLRVLREDPALAFDALVELTAADYLPREPRYEVVYHLVRFGSGTLPPLRVRLKVQVPGDTPSVPTVTGLFAAANWLEREVWDLFGIVFEGHPDLRRLLMMDDWEGHPLRKDYPVQVSVPYRSTQAVELTEQEFLANVQRQRQATGSPRRQP
jgi:NADH-quinone oxidoreductase subunit C